MPADDVGLEFILDFFGDRIGYLVDVGAYDGVIEGSMSCDLMVKGWSGLLVEPLKEAFLKLELAYIGNPNATCVQVACSNCGGTVDLYPCAGVSTLEKDWADACQACWSHINYGESQRVVRVMLKELLAVHAPSKIDYLKIDTEGHDFKVLLEMDWSFDPDLICVETLDMVHLEKRKKDGKFQPGEDLDALLVNRGYKLVLTTIGGNGIYIKEKL